MKQKKFKQNLGQQENMTSLKEEEDIYLCANRKILRPTQMRKKEPPSGYLKEKTLYEGENGEGYAFKSKCITTNGNKKLSASKRSITYRETSLENLNSDEEERLRVNRSIQVEDVFGSLNKT